MATPTFSNASLIATFLILLASPALADPCKAIPDNGPMPSYLAKGTTFSGPVTYVGDADSLCVAVGGRAPENLVEVRVADFYGPEINAPGGRDAKATLERIVKGRHVVCTAGRRSFDRVVAICRLGGVTIGDLMRGAGVEERGNGR